MFNCDPWAREMVMVMMMMAMIRINDGVDETDSGVPNE